jgi:geranylgeranyl diphosphate synthase type II
MTSFDLDPWLAERRAKIDALLDAKLALSGDDPGRLNDAMRYSLLAPGKRLRPLLALAAGEALSVAQHEPILLAAGAVELVHCYSLIHDDLPAMDDDDFRRGRPTNHKVFGEAIAILAGDALLTLAFQWLAEAAQLGGPLYSERSLHAVMVLARGAGMKGMVRGQARDVTPKANPTLETLETLHKEKTGALFRSAMEVGGAMAGASSAQLEALANFGTCYGIAFQHRDDQSDNENQGFAEPAQQRIHELCNEAVESLQGFGKSAEVLRTMALRLDLR